MANTIYKLTDTNLQTYGGFQWVVGEWREAPGEGSLCTRGWLHGYDGPEVAMFMAPCHVDFSPFLMWRGEWEGRTKDDCGLKRGVQRQRILEELNLCEPTTTQRVAFGILCTLPAYHKPDFIAWATGWLDGTDRTWAAAAACADEAEAAAKAAAAACAAAKAEEASAKAAAWRAWAEAEAKAEEASAKAEAAAAACAAARAEEAEAAAEAASAAAWRAWAAEAASSAARAAADGTLDVSVIARKAMTY